MGGSNRQYVCVDDGSERASSEASGAYESVEKEYLEALAAGADEDRLRSLASRAAEAAKSWETADYAVASKPSVERYYSVPEVLWSLWVDVAAAYERRAG